MDKLTVLDLLERSAAKSPDSPVAVTTDRALTYQQLVGISKQVAKALTKETSKPVVALFFPMTPEFVAAYFSVLYAGKQALPMNLLLPPEDLKYILNDSGADVIVTVPDFVARLQPLGVKVLDFAELAKSNVDAELPRPGPDDICTLLYTSGTTGKPKGVQLTHNNLASNAADVVSSIRLEPSCRLLACLPSFHTFAITGTMLAPIAAAASLATLPKFDPEAVLKMASALHCDTLMMVPSMYRLVTRMQERKPVELKLRLAISGGEALPDDVREKFEKTFGLPLLEGYGQTESGPVISFNLPWSNKIGTVGKPIPHVEIRIVDPETQKDVPAGGTGEIWAKGPNIMKGYQNKPEETAKALTTDGWLRTGDMGEIDPDGFIRITGRLREMVKVAGEMVFPVEVENALLLHPAVSEAGVAGFKDERKGEIVKAFIILKAGETATEDNLLQHCRAKLAAYKVPRSVEFRTELPKGPTGKIMRRLLK